MAAASVGTLKSRRDFVRVQNQGRRFRDKHMLVLVARGQPGLARAGITVSRKVGKAVTRNRVRRRLREILRAEGKLLAAGCDHVVVAYPRAAAAAFATLREELRCLLEQARGSGLAAPSV